jgi:D-arabinose 1-dehydrogenase-like Zn-dependent alcohol dehydrogenase
MALSTRCFTPAGGLHRNGIAAPIFCAGHTVVAGLCDASPQPGERVAVLGVGGLGHLAIQYAKSGKVVPRLELYPLERVNHVRERLEAGKVRYRAVLVHAS